MLIKRNFQIAPFKPLLFLTVILCMSTLFTASCSGETFSSVLAKLYGDKGGEPPPPVALFAGVEISNFTVEALDEGNAMRTSWTLTAENPNFSHLTLQWGRDDQNGGEFIEEGEARLDEGENTYDITGLMNNVEYTISIYASDNDGNTSEPVRRTGVPQDILPPQPAANLITSAPPSGTEARLGWDRPDEDDFERLEITWTPAEGSPASPWSTTDAETTMLTITGLTRLQTYTFTITIYDDDGNGSPVTASVTPGDETPPAAVTSVSSTPGDRQITLGWTNPTDPDFTRVEIGITGGGLPPNTLVSVSSPMSSYTFMSGTMGGTMVNVQDGTEYTFTLTAFDGSGNDSAPVSETQRTLPGEVGSFTAEPPTVDGQITLNWAHPAGDSDSHDMYNISGGATVTVLGTATSTTITGLDDGRTYTFNIVAVDVNNNPSVTEETATGRTRPGPVTNFTASPTISSGPVMLSWVNPTSNPNFAGVRITGGGISQTDLTSPAASRIIMPMPDGMYMYTIVALDNNTPTPNQSSSVASGSVTVDTTPPGNVMGFTAMRGGSGAITLNWTAATDADSYRITWEPGGMATPMGTTELITGLANGTSYTFTIVAFDAVGNPSVTPAMITKKPCNAAITTPDMDSDNISDNCDNCPMVANPAQTDADGDGAGALCDNDTYVAIWSRGTRNGVNQAPAPPFTTGREELDRRCEDMIDSNLTAANGGVTSLSDHSIRGFISVNGGDLHFQFMHNGGFLNLPLRGPNEWDGNASTQGQIINHYQDFFMTAENDTGRAVERSLFDSGITGVGNLYWSGLISLSTRGALAPSNTCSQWFPINPDRFRGQVGLLRATDYNRVGRADGLRGERCDTMNAYLCVAYPVETCPATGCP